MKNNADETYSLMCFFRRVQDTITIKSKDDSKNRKNIITAIKNGKTEVIISQGKEELLAKVIVLDNVKFVKKIKMDISKLKSEKGDEYAILYDVEPIDVLNKTLSWENSNNNVVTVSETGVLRVISSGTAEIKVGTTDGRDVEKIIKVTVSNVDTETEIEPVESIK